MNKTVDTLAERLKRCRAEAKLTQQQLADAAGISAAAIAQIESGDTKSIKAENLFPLARALRKNPEWLLTGKGEPVDYSQVIEAFRDLPHDSGQQSLDFLSYSWNRAEGLVASDQIAHYITMIDNFKRDLDKRKNKK